MRWGSGTVFEVQRKRGPVWYAKYRQPSGRQVQKLIGPAWHDRGAAPAGYFTQRTAEKWLQGQLRDMQLGLVAGLVDTGVTFADAAEEYLRFAAEDRGCKPSTIVSYRSAIKSHLIPAFGARRIEDITTRDIELWRATSASARDDSALTNKSKNNLLVLLNAIMRRAVKLHGLPKNPVDNVDRLRVRARGDIQVFTPEEIWSLVRAAASELDGAIYLTAAFTGLRRGEILALRWRDVDFSAFTIRVRASYAGGQLTTPKSGKVRAVPLAPDVAASLAKLGQRDEFIDDDDFVFAGLMGDPINGDALSARYRVALKAAGLRPLRFHDLRHTFGTRMISQADIRRVQEWMGHADIQTTMKYLHYESRAEDAQLVAQAFAPRSAALAQRQPSSTP